MVGVCCWFSKFWPYFCPKNVIFHTRFQNWHLKSITVIRPGLKAEIMLWLFRLKRKQKDFSTSISNSHISLTFFFILNWNDQYVYTLSVPSEPYLIPDKNGQNVYPFSDQNGTKTIPFGAAHTYIQSTPDNSNLQGKLKKSLSYRKFHQNSWE